MPALSTRLDREHVMRHLTLAVANGFNRAMAQKLLDSYDLGLIVCTERGDEMDISYTALGHRWDVQGQPWGVA